MKNSFNIRRASQNDAFLLETFLNYELKIHRHLDWREPLDWLGSQPFWLILQDERIVAALACPADPTNVAWIRLFCCAGSINQMEAWKLLFEKAKCDLLAQYQNITIAAVSLRDWFTRILVSNDFIHHQDIVILEWQLSTIKHKMPSKDIILREMTQDDLIEVANIDQKAFSSLWHIPYNGLSKAYNLSTYSIVAEMNEKIIGFQISTSNPFGAHLARLAVIPDMQRNSIGYQLVEDLIQHYIQLGIDRITVNTQKENRAAISLYQNLNFKSIYETFPVFLYNKQLPV